MGRSDYVPANAAQFKFFMENIIKYAAPKITEQPQDWPVPLERWNELNSAFETFDNAFAAAEKTPTPANISERPVRNPFNRCRTEGTQSVLTVYQQVRQMENYLV